MKTAGNWMVSRKQQAFRVFIESSSSNLRYKTRWHELVTNVWLVIAGCHDQQASTAHVPAYVGRRDLHP